jgi:hypothetical protein
MRRSRIADVRPTGEARAMGALTDFILGTQQELACVPAAPAPISVLPGIDLKGTTMPPGT